MAATPAQDRSVKRQTDRRPKDAARSAVRGNFPPYKTVAVADLIPYAGNARTHSDEQVAQIAASIREFGFTNPVLVDGERGIIAGHGRVMAARKLGLPEVPTIELSHLTEAQRRAYVIADNSSPGQAVYEPFSGSGTTIIAGEMTGRCVHAIELNPAYIDVAVQRWQAFTGQQATLEGDKRTFAEATGARHGA